MRTKTVNIYKFNELSEEAKEKALDTVREWQVDYEWWDGVYEDAENVGIKITSFDLDRNRHAKGDFLLSADEVAANIIRDQGDMCETYKTAQSFLDKQNELEMPEDDTDEFSEWEDKRIELEDEFKQSILEDYSIMLQNEYEYRVSDEAVAEFIEANDYEFTEDGKVSR